MNDLENRRRYPRVNVNSEHTVRFTAVNRGFQDLPMTNLSAGGCCVRIPAREASLLQKETTVTKLRLLHPKLPGVPLQGKVSWILGKQADNLNGFTFVGLQFINPNPNFVELLDEYVTGLLAEHG